MESTVHVLVVVLFCFVILPCSVITVGRSLTLSIVFSFLFPAVVLSLLCCSGSWGDQSVAKDAFPTTFLCHTNSFSAQLSSFGGSRVGGSRGCVLSV